MVKTWQCALLSVLVHGLLIFCLPVMPNSPQVMPAEEVRLLFMEPSPPGLPAAATSQPASAMKSTEPPEPGIPADKEQKRPPAEQRKKPVHVAKTVRHVPKAHPISKAPPQQPLEKEDAIQPAEPPDADGAGAEGSPAPDNATAHSGTGNAEDQGLQGHGGAGGGNDHGSVVESTVGAMGGPQFIQRTDPKYPRVAQRLGMEGAVLLRLAIDASGKLTKVELVKGSGNGFDEAAIDAVKQSTFSPAVRNGRPISCLALLKIRFQLSD